MADFNQAVQWMKKGKKVRRKCIPNDMWHIHLGITGKYDEKWDKQIWDAAEKPYSLLLDDIEATDWEIYDQGTLSDCIYDGVDVDVIDKGDVKDTVTIIKQDIEEILSKFTSKHKINPIESGQELGKINSSINKRMGPKLT